MIRIRAALISPKTSRLQGNQSKCEVAVGGWGLGAGEGGPLRGPLPPGGRCPSRASHLPAAGVAPHPRVELVVASFVLAARAVNEAQWHGALALQEAVFVPPLQLGQ
jgi:hypothetical protein